MRLTIRQRLITLSILLSAASTLPLYYVSSLSFSASFGITLIFILASWVVSAYFTKDFADGLQALEMGLLNFKDGEYSTSIAHHTDDEFSALCHLYNDTAEKLRDEKHWLYQRELLLDKITQSSPQALLLINNQQQVVFSNIAARHFFRSQRSLEGQTLTQLLDSADNGLQMSMLEMQDGLFTLNDGGQESQTWHLSKGAFSLNGQPHTLFILKHMTRELSRQEVAVWKKVIRIISHELNNSLGPIASMLQSGKILTQSVQDERLNRVFDTIEDRIAHLSDFVQGYGKFAKLPEPKKTPVDMAKLLQPLSEQWQFRADIDPAVVINADPIQLEQLLINLIKNAHESGSDANEIQVSVSQQAGSAIIEVKDKGKGMTDTVLNQALIPFYSTKATGSGLGLALCREIADAHQGNITLQNRTDGGVCVKLVLP